MEKPPSKTGIARLVSACSNSLRGFAACYRSEEAFRQESIAFILLLPVIMLLPVSATLKLLLLMANSLVLVAELLNSAVETIVDKVSPEYDELAGRAKDMGSAAVFVSLALAAVFWGCALYILVGG